MTAERVQRDKLAAALPHEAFCALWMPRGKPCQCSQREAALAALLPVVREIVAEELREAADRVHLAETFSEAAQLCHNRADALSGPRTASTPPSDTGGPTDPHRPSRGRTEG